MIRHVLAASALLLLAACTPSPEQVLKVKSVLPSGCVVHDAGSYGSIDQLVVVVCDDRKTVSTNTYERHGKTHRTSAVFAVQ